MKYLSPIVFGLTMLLSAVTDSFLKREPSTTDTPVSLPAASLDDRDVGVYTFSDQCISDCNPQASDSAEMCFGKFLRYQVYMRLVMSVSSRVDE